MINIKQCTVMDSHYLSTLSSTIWHECYKEMLSLEQRNYMLNKFLNPTSIKESILSNVLFYYIYFNDEICGYFAYIIKEDHIYLSKLYVLKEYRGKGLFHYILNYLNSFKKDIKLNTCKTNKTLNIYLHVGFEIYEEAKHDIGNGFFMDDYNLIKKYK